MLHSVVAGRRYVIGKGDDCDLRVNGIYTSRRHAELWFDAGAWYVADAGSTNGLRMQQIDAAGIDPRQTQTAPPGGSQTIRLQPRMRLVLSARAEGPAGEYPWIAMGPGRSAAVAATPIAAAPHDAGDLAGRAAPMTPRTAVVTARSTEPVFEMTESRAAGSRVHALRRSELPITVGRSRGQTVVIDWSFAGRLGAPSGHRRDRRRGGARHGPRRQRRRTSAASTTPPAAHSTGRSARKRSSAARCPASPPACSRSTGKRSDDVAPPLSPGLLTPLEPGRSDRRAIVDDGTRTTQALYSGALRRLAVAANSSCGSQHAVNEDACSELDSREPLFVVADGVGGGAMAQAASRWLVAHLHRAFDTRAPDAALVGAVMLEADQAIAHAHCPGDSTIPARRPSSLPRRSTARAGRWLLAWVGDCRAYRWSAQASPRLALLTRDDTFSNLGEAPPAGGSADDPARMVGNGATLGANVATHDLACGDLLILCSDGVHKHLDDDAWARALESSMNLADRCRQLVVHARARGSVDDATALLIERQQPVSRARARPASDLGSRSRS